MGYEVIKNPKSRRQRLISAIMVGFGRMLVCEECRTPYWFGEEGDLCQLCDERGVTARLRKITEFERRSYLMDWTGVHSLKLCDTVKLMVVLERMRNLGYPRRETHSKALQRSKYGMLANLLALAEQDLGDNWENRIRGFCRKQFGVEDPQWLNLSQIRQLWGFVRRASKYAKGGER